MSDPNNNHSRVFDEWWSPSLGKDMELLRFGESGTPILAFPGNKGHYYDWENHRLVDALNVQIDNGYNQLFCVDNPVKDGFENPETDPKVAIQRQRQYELYIAEEVIPYIFSQTGHDFLIAAGINTGAYQALNITFKHPRKVGKLVAMSGIYDIKSYFDDYYDDNIYLSNPMDYIPNIGKPNVIADLQSVDIRIVVSQYDAEFSHSKCISEQMNAKGIHHTLDIWRKEELREWNLWAEMLHKHIP